MIKGITTGTNLEIIDTSGALIGKVIGFKRYKARKNRYPKGTIGDKAIITVKKGDNEKIKKIFFGIITSQKAHYKRGTLNIIGKNNSCILVNKEGNQISKYLRTPVYKELFIKHNWLTFVNKKEI